VSGVYYLQYAVNLNLLSIFGIKNTFTLSHNRIRSIIVVKKTK
jgi:hypothetical protein